MTKFRQLLGQAGENQAITFLKKNGYHILEKNYRSKLGEIDVIAKDSETIAFIEVKTRRSTYYGHPKEAITLDKQKKISMTALEYLKKHKLIHSKARFDVITISYISQKPDIQLIKNAFELKYAVGY